ncbi:MAG TPA: SCO family protein, partial [Gemmatimonadales bacterium]|nr:SCO family protein [Gemmatimonadales bacterium]
VVFVSTDPRRDTPVALRRWLDHFNPAFIGLTGDSATIANALKELDLGGPVILPGRNDTSYSVMHAAMVLAYSRDDLAHAGFPFGIRQKDWVHYIQALVDQ